MHSAVTAASCAAGDELTPPRPDRRQRQNREPGRVTPCYSFSVLRHHQQLPISHTSQTPLTRFDPMRTGRSNMTRTRMSRRTMLKGASALGALVAASGELFGQQQPGSRSAAAPPTPLPPRGEFVIRGATVLTMDPNLGDLETCDVHVRDGAIVAIGPRIDLPNAGIMEGRGMICMPGFVDTHWHLWTSLLRPFVRADLNEVGYFPVSNRLGQLFTPEDSYRSVMLGIAEALSAGVTTVHNWAHNVRSPDHADTELSAMRDAGIRGRFAYGPAQG